MRHAVTLALAAAFILSSCTNDDGVSAHDGDQAQMPVNPTSAPQEQEPVRSPVPAPAMPEPVPEPQPSSPIAPSSPVGGDPLHANPPAPAPEANPEPTPVPEPAPTPPAVPEDAELVDRVRAALSGVPTLATLLPNLEVSAKSGTVTLKGSVPTEADRALVASSTSEVQGVTSVDNQIVIGPR